MVRRRTEKGEASRMRLLAAAAAEFARCGYHEAKVSGIVAAAGLTQAAFYLYFPSKEAIFAELVSAFTARLRELADAGRKVTGMAPAAVPAEVQQNLLLLFRFLAADPGLTRVALFVNPSAEQIRQEVVEMVAANLRRNQAAGLVRPGLNVSVVAECAVAMVIRATERWVLGGEGDIEVLAAQVSEIFLNGVLVR